MRDRSTGVQSRSVAVTLSVAAGCWAIAATQMRGMDMGVATTLGSFRLFIGLWAAMMAAMMLPGAVPAVSSYARAHRRVSAVPLFVAAYVLAWTLFGVAAFAVYRPHTVTAAGIVTVAAGLYEFTPVKRLARRRCRELTSSGFHYGLYCMGSSIGLMAMLLALGAMSLTWMSAIAAIVLLQKLLPPRTTVDVVLSVAIVAFGALLLSDPSFVPGLAPAM